MTVDTIVGIAFVAVSVCTAAGWAISRIGRNDPAPEPGPEPDAAAVEPHWADLAQPLDSAATVDDILADLDPARPYIPIIPGRDDQWTDVIDHDPVDQHLINAIAKADAAADDPLAWTADPTACDPEFLDIYDALEIDDLFTHIVDAHLYDAEETP